MTDATTLENDLEGLVALVDGGRAEGLSVAAACRAAGISTSTYYRRRRMGAVSAPLTALTAHLAPDSHEIPAQMAAALAAPTPERTWPFPPATPRAPFYWDQVFSNEMTDSFVRREFGVGTLKRGAMGALGAIAAPATPLLDQVFPGASAGIRRMVSRLGVGPLGVALGPLVAMAFLLLLVVTAGWMVSVAADPAAWLSHPEAAKLAAADMPLTR